MIDHMGTAVQRKSCSSLTIENTMTTFLILLLAWTFFWPAAWIFTRKLQNYTFTPLVAIFEPCDCWVGVFYDKRKRLIYFFPLPMVGWVFHLKRV